MTDCGCELEAKGDAQRKTLRVVLAINAAVAMFELCFVGSVQEGLHRLTTGADADRILIVFQENRFCPTSSRLPEDCARKIKDMSRNHDSNRHGFTDHRKNVRD